MRSVLVTASFCFSALLTSGLAEATIVHEQLPGSNSTDLLISSTLNNNPAPESPGFGVADVWTLPTDTVITNLNWWGVSNSGADLFQFTFYSDAGTVPGTILMTTRGFIKKTTVNIGHPADPLTFYESELSLPFAA